MSVSMGTIGRMMRTTRTNMIASKVDAASELFSERFGMRDGDYIEFDRWNSRGGKLPTIGRIVEVENCYYNSVKGYTAFIKVAPLLQSGRLGNTRMLMLTVNAKGTEIEGAKKVEL